MALGLVGLMLAIECTMHAYGVGPRLWEPLPQIGPGNWVLRPVAVPAPELDVIGFASIVMTSALGSRDRWQTRPALALATGAAVVLTALSVVTRWGWQYASLQTTSTLFFLMMATAIVLLPLVASEVHAAATHRRAGYAPRSVEWSALAGVAAILIGTWLLVWPESTASVKASTHGHLVGAFVVAIGALSLSRVGRPARWLNALIGVWLFFAPALHGYALRGALQSMVAGLLLVVASMLLVEPREAPSAPLRRRGT